jgi:signal transduction histidine kinase
MAVNCATAQGDSAMLQDRHIRREIGDGQLELPVLATAGDRGARSRPLATTRDVLRGGRFRERVRRIGDWNRRWAIRSNWRGSAAQALLLYALGVRAMAAQAPASPPMTKMVLMLYSDDRLLPANIVLDSAIRATLASDSGPPVQFFSEFLDVTHFPDSSQRTLVRNYLREKYHAPKPDLIITVGAPAFLFLLRSRGSLFGDIPIVYSGLTSIDPPGVLPDTRVVGARDEVDWAGTLSLALQLQPDTRRVVVVSGATPQDLGLVEKVRAQLQPFVGRISFVWLSDRTMAQLRREVAGLPAHTVVLYLSMFGDAAGVAFSPRQALKEFSSVSAVPVYGGADTFFGYGIVGGSMVSFGDAGRATGQIARRILAGVAPAAAAGGDLLAKPMVDARQLRQWHLSESRLPAGTVVWFRPHTLWDDHRDVLIAIGAALLLQSLLILALLAQRRASRAANIETAQYRERLAHVVRVHTVGEMSAAIAHEINQPLVAIENYAQAAHRRLVSGAGDDRSKVVELLSKIRAQAAHAGDVLQRIRSMLKKHETEVVEFDLGQLAIDTIQLAAVESRFEGFHVEAVIGPGLPAVAGDPIQIQQVLLNLMRNAIEAMDGKGTGKRVLTIDVQRRGFDEVGARVIDGGCGVAPEQTARLFDPFYSTKASGLGIGLSLCRSIVMAHKGQLTFAPNPGGGSVFEFTLPTAKEHA